MCSKRTGCFVFASLMLVTMACACTAFLLFRATGPSAGCQNPVTGAAQPGISVRRLASGGRQRCYLLHIPPRYDPGQPLPVVFSLHGFASNAEGQARIPKWSQLADRESFIVVYPEGTSFPRRWNAADAFLARDVDDVQFFRDIVADLAQIASIDPERIYVSGISNGGTMSHRIACEAADLVTAIGTVAALPLETPGGCQPSRPVPLIAFHGTADPLVSYDGGTYHAMGLGRLLPAPARGLSYPPIETWIANWAERNGCSVTPEAGPRAGDATCLHYSDCRNGADVVLYTIEDGGHTWPGSAPIPFFGKTSQDVDASAVMWGFFQAHTLHQESEE